MQVRLSEAKNALASRAPSSERFRACCDGLAAHPDERDALLVCLWDLARNTNQMETSPGKAENVPSSANVQRPTLNVAQPAGVIHAATVQAIYVSHSSRLTHPQVQIENRTTHQTTDMLIMTKVVS